MIEPRYFVLQELFGNRVFRIPHYQRFYSWQKRQRDDLFGDLRKLSSGNEEQHHFMATIVCHRTAETKDIGATQYRLYDVVDGQQRLTTLIILLKVIELELPETSEERTELSKILVKRDGHLILLQTNNANEIIFNQFIREGREPTTTDLQTRSDRNLTSAIQECRRFVKAWSSNGDIIFLMRLLLHRLGFVVFDTENSRIVYTIFEVLNSRGLAVDWLDKTKSVLMGMAFELAKSPEAAAAEIEALQKIWADIYRELARVDIPGEEILRITATLYYGSGRGKPLSAEDSLDALRKKCKSFEDPTIISKRLLDIARKLVALYASTHLGPVTEILHARLLAVAIKLATGVNESERQKLLEQWERVTFRIFGLFHNDARTKVGDYVRLAFNIVDANIANRTYNQIMSSLRQLGQEYPIEQAVEEGLKEKNFYEHPEECRYLLWSYEEHLASGPSATVDENEKARIWRRQATDSIEHIFPQSPLASAWRGKMRTAQGVSKPQVLNVHRIGNLLLLPARLNQEAQDSAFSTKKEKYARHHLRMVEEVCRNNDWTLSEIEDREARILAWAKARWCDV